MREHLIVVHDLLGSRDDPWVCPIRGKGPCVCTPTSLKGA